MARRPVPPHPVTRRNRILRHLLAVVYLLSLLGLVAWEYRDHLAQLSSHCDGLDDPKPALFTVPYTWLLDWSRGETSTPVSIVAIPENLEEIKSNFCEGREYLADLLLTIAPQHPYEIVVDKFYSPAACNSSPQSTLKLVSTVQSLNTPIIVGESTALALQKHGGACLVRKPQLDFASPNVHHGITRLDATAEQIPLQWFVLPSDSPNAVPQIADSLSLTAIKVYDQDFTHRRRIQRLLDTHLNPYAKLNVDLPRQTSTDLFCSTGTADMRKRWAVDCSHPGPHPSLLGKIVVIGAEQDPDRRLVIGIRMWGFDIQARYIAAMLSSTYLHALPFWLPLLLFALFVFIIEGLPTLFVAYRPHWKKHPLLSSAFHRRRYLWIIFWTFAFIFSFTVLSLLLGYLPPLILFSDILLLVVTRLLFFAAESVETPFLHPSNER